MTIHLERICISNKTKPEISWLLALKTYYYFVCGFYPKSKRENTLIIVACLKGAFKQLNIPRILLRDDQEEKNTQVACMYDDDANAKLLRVQVQVFVLSKHSFRKKRVKAEPSFPVFSLRKGKQQGKKESLSHCPIFFGPLEIILRRKKIFSTSV